MTKFHFRNNREVCFSLNGRKLNCHVGLEKLFNQRHFLMKTIKMLQIFLRTVIVEPGLLGIPNRLLRILINKPQTLLAKARRPSCPHLKKLKKKL